MSEADRPAQEEPPQPAGPVEPPPAANDDHSRQGSGSAPPAHWDTQKITLTSALRTPLLKNLLRVPLKKIVIWSAFAAVLVVLWDFFGLIFLTFVLSYITSSIVDRVSSYFSSRRIPTLLVFALILGLITGLGWATLPRAVREAQEQLQRLRERDQSQKFNLGRLVGQRPEIETLGAQQGGVFGAIYGDARRREPGLVSSLAWYLGDSADLINEGMREAIPAAQEGLIGALRTIVESAWKSALYVFLALIFSFMIVWDRPRLAEGIDRLRYSRLGDVWVEVAPSIATFARLLGKAFEAQTIIALVNATLTTVGMLLMGIPGIGLLSLTVFICSFVPIAGVYVSTIPICLVALQQSGVGLAAAVIAMVSGVHLIEAYVLNPRIYGAHMKLHPLAVLIVLTIGGHLLGVWGLILGVPLATYVWRHLVLGQAEHIYAEQAPLVAEEVRS